MLGYTRDSTFYILWAISVLFIDELYQFPYWRYHVFCFPNVCLLTCSHFINHLYIWSSFTHHPSRLIAYWLMFIVCRERDSKFILSYLILAQEAAPQLREMNNLSTAMEQQQNHWGRLWSAVKYTGPRFNIDSLPRYGDSHVKDKIVARLVRRHLYTETAPWLFR